MDLLFPKKGPKGQKKGSNLDLKSWVPLIWSQRQPKPRGLVPSPLDTLIPSGHFHLGTEARLVGYDLVWGPQVGLANPIKRLKRAKKRAKIGRDKRGLFDLEPETA